MVFGQPVYNTEQRRTILGQMKQYLDKEWLKKRAAGLLTKKKISKKRKRKRIKRNNLKQHRVKIRIKRRRRR